jgi:hypothetical protein
VCEVNVTDLNGSFSSVKTETVNVVTLTHLVIVIDTSQWVRMKSRQVVTLAYLIQYKWHGSFPRLVYAIFLKWGHINFKVCQCNPSVTLGFQ